MYSLKDAAEAIGMGKPAVLKAIQKGRISAQKDEHGQWRIDPAELHRVYPPVSGNGAENGSSERQETHGNDNGNRTLEREIELLRERMTEKDDQIADLRGERDRLLKVIEEQAGSVKLLTDMSHQAREPVPEAAQPAAQKPVSGFWRWLRPSSTRRA